VTTTFVAEVIKTDHYMIETMAVSLAWHH